MLRELHIRNVALIDNLEISFAAGLNVITGETGSGKSMLIRSLALLCGERASPDLIRDGAESASVEGLFELRLPCELADGFGIEEDDVLIRRLVSRNGKSKVFVNGRPITLGLLAALGLHTVHIYGQHEQTLLLRPSSHLELLDSFAEIGELRSEMSSSYAALAETERQLSRARENLKNREQRRDLLSFQLQELTTASPQPQEEESLQKERAILRNAERLHLAAREAEALLYSSDDPMSVALARLAARLEDLSRIDPALREPARALESARLEIEEAARALGRYSERVTFDPERLNAIEDRLALLARLSRKYAVSSDGLAALTEQIRTELDSLDRADEALSALEAEAARRREHALAIARRLHSARNNAARTLEKKMMSELEVLGMSGARFTVEQQLLSDERLNAAGLDQIEFHFSANRGARPQPLARIASGGELSRIMLALKALTARASETPILIFDEVDAGIGGAVADAVGKRLKVLASSRQLLCITHLPQIAAYANHHLAVEKTVQNGRTITRARALTEAERITEISRMLGGTVAPSEAAVYAQRLVDQAQSFA